MEKIQRYRLAEAERDESSDSGLVQDRNGFVVLYDAEENYEKAWADLILLSTFQHDAGPVRVGALIERIAALEQRVKELEAECNALHATVERLTRPVTDAWKQGKGDSEIFMDAEGRN